MNVTNEIIASQIASRCCRRELYESENINNIVKECCENLHTPIPKVLYCETMAKNFSAFYLRKKPHLVYDSCLTESLVLYNCIIDTNIANSDIDKFFCKFVGEELLKEQKYISSLLFAKIYNTLSYSFEDTPVPNHINRQISFQNYFLIAHELTHLSLHDTGYTGIPNDYKHFLNISFKLLTERARDNRSIDNFLNERYGYFLDICPNSLDDYYSSLPTSYRYQHFTEECYCDFKAMQLLMESYANPEESIRAISVALNYLITQEYIRSDLFEKINKTETTESRASLSMYLSVFRMEILLITIQMNNFTYLDQIFQEMQNRLDLIEHWKNFINRYITPNVLEISHFPEDLTFSKKELVDLLFKSFYYCHID